MENLKITNKEILLATRGMSEEVCSTINKVVDKYILFTSLLRDKDSDFTKLVNAELALNTAMTELAALQSQLVGFLETTQDSPMLEDGESHLDKRGMH